jgi:hypothetical protein
MLPDLLIVYTLSENIQTFIIKSDDPRYEAFNLAHGCYINGNDEDYPFDVVEVVSDPEDVDVDRDFLKEDPLEITGYFKIIQCGFYA